MNGARTPLPPPERVLALRERSGWLPQPARAGEHGSLLEQWIAADPDHAGKVSADVWLAQQTGVQNLLVNDREGALLFVRLSNALRIDMQFAPEHQAQRRTVRALASGLPWLVDMARSRSYRELIFESVSPTLVRFVGRLGFHASPDEYILGL